MRILNVTQSYSPFFEFGGPPVKVRALAEGLARLGHDVTVLTADWGLDRRLQEKPGEVAAESNPFGRKRHVNGVTAFYLPTWFHFRAASWNPALGRYLRARLREFDIVHIFGLYDLFGPRTARACRELEIPYVVEPIGMFVPIVRNVWLKRLYHQLFGKQLLRGASAVIATSEQERAELLAGGFAIGKIVLRRNGVEGPEKAPERGTFREARRIPADAKLILFLGRLSKKKSPDLLLEAFASVVAAADPGTERAHLAFVGPDEAGMLAKLQERAAKLSLGERVHFCEPLEGLAKWAAYRDADLFVLPSQNENFGNTAAEAVAVGTPVIVTDQCGIAPLLADLAGIVVKHEREELAEAIRRLLLDRLLYKELHNGCTAAFSNMSWAQPLQDMDKLFRRLAGGTGS